MAFPTRLMGMKYNGRHRQPVLVKTNWNALMDAQPRVFVTRRLPAVGLNRIAAASAMEVWPEPLPPPPEVLREKMKDCRGVVSLLTDRIDQAILEAAPQLKVISNFAVGINNIDLAVATARGIRVGNTPGVLTDATADLAVSLLLASARRLLESAKAASTGQWRTWEPVGWLGQELVGRTLGIVGMGRIGLAMAKRCHFGWDMPVLYTARSTKLEAEQQLGARRVEFAELLSQSDFVSLHCDLNPSTYHLMNDAAFAQMKASAVLINTARGPVVDQAALAAALRGEKIFAAGIDVTEPEPLPPEHELYQLSNLIVVPHIASATVATRNAMASICAANLVAGLRDEPMPHCVNPEVKAGTA